MIDAILNSAFFGLTLSTAAWCFGRWVQKKTGWVICNPLLVASLVIIAFLAVFHIPLAQYNLGGDMIKLMLGPVTAVLALNIYQQRKVLGQYFLPVLAGIVGAVFAPLFAKAFRITDPVAEGLAIGACSHALGTTKAMEIGPLQGAMSSIAICVCGIITSILALFI